MSLATQRTRSCSTCLKAARQEYPRTLIHFNFSISPRYEFGIIRRPMRRISLFRLCTPMVFLSCDNHLTVSQSFSLLEGQVQESQPISLTISIQVSSFRLPQKVRFCQSQHYISGPCFINRLKSMLDRDVKSPFPMRHVDLLHDVKRAGKVGHPP